MTDQEKGPKIQDQTRTGEQPSLPSAFDLLGPSWNAVKLNLITLIEFTIIPIFLSLLIIVFWNSSIPNLFNLLPDVASLLIAPGLTYTLLEGAKGKSIDFFPAFLKGLKFFWRYLGLAILMSILIAGGLILLIIPGIFMLRNYYLAPYYLIDRNLGVLETMRLCKQESKQFTGPILLVFCLQILFVAIMVIPFIGTFAGIILSVMYYSAPAIRYKQIKHALGIKSSKNTKQTSAAS